METVPHPSLANLRTLLPTLPLPQRRRLGLVLVALVLVLFVTAMRPRHVTVNGVRQGLPHGGTAAACARAAGMSLAAGDLVDIHGGTLTPGGGTGPLFYRNGETCPPDQRLRSGDKLDVTPGQDVTEPIKETATLLPYHFETAGPGGSYFMVAQPGIVGIRRVERGAMSGKVKTIEVAAASPAVVYEGHSKDPGKRIALTFDDGPHPQFTGQMLDILKRYNAHATFFVLSSLVQYWPQFVRREIAEGHEVGIHTWDHANLTHMSPSAIQADMAKCEHTLRPIVGAPIRWMRPPYGAINRSARETISGMGYHIALWSVDTNDWQRPGSSVVCSRVVNGAHNGAIVLMHDGGGPRQGTVDAVQNIVPALQKAGYELVTLSQLTGEAPVMFDGRMIITSAEGTWKVTLAPAGLRVTVDGEPVRLPVQPVEVDGQLLLPASSVLKEMGASYEWDQAAQILRLQTLRGRIVLRMNTRRVEINGERDLIHTPPILYRGEPMVPLWLLVNYCGGRARYDTTSHTLDLDTPYRGTSLTAPVNTWGFGIPRLKAAGVSWRQEYRL